MNTKKLRLGSYIQIVEASAIGLDRLNRGCFVCGLLPEEKGLESGGEVCPKCKKRS